MDTKEELTLANIKGGAVMESVEIRLSEVLENLADPNAGNGKRVIILNLAFTPDKNNPQIINISTSCKSNLAPDKDISTVAVLSSNSLFELQPNMEQTEMFQEEQAKPGNVRDFKTAAAAGEEGGAG